MRIAGVLLCGLLLFGACGLITTGLQELDNRYQARQAARIQEAQAAADLAQAQALQAMAENAAESDEQLAAAYQLALMASNGWAAALVVVLLGVVLSLARGRKPKSAACLAPPYQAGALPPGQIVYIPSQPQLISWEEYRAKGR